MNKTNNKNNMIVIGVILIVALAGFMLTRGEKDVKKSKLSSLPQVEILPTVGPDVKVTLTADKKKQEAHLTVSGIPDDTSFIEYELSYNADVEGESVPKGVIGTIEYENEDPIERDITLGTCSSGTCKYDTGVSSVNVSLKFQGGYGAQLYTGEFDL